MEGMSRRYDSIGVGYARTRQEDSDVRRRIHGALGAAYSVVNVGAGAGSYEPLGRDVLAIEPSAVMVAQRPTGSAPAILASAGKLPLRDDSVDAAMAVLTIHHWDAELRSGLQELRRVARGPIAILTYDPAVSAQMWLMAEYLPEVAKLDLETFPRPEEVATWLGGARVDVVPTRADTPDWTLGSFWAHPERVLDESARNHTSGFARQPREVVERAVAAVQRDLANGTWDERHGALRQLEELDVGMRLVIASE